MADEEVVSAESLFRDQIAPETTVLAGMSTLETGLEAGLPRDVALVIENRIAALRQELATGEVELQKATRHQVSLQETMLRISGAIQVLEELLATGVPAGGNGHHPDG